MTDGNISFGEEKRVHIKILGLCSVTQKVRASCEHRTHDTSASVSVKNHRGLLAKQPLVPKKSGESCQRSAHTLLPEQPQLIPVLWLTSLQHSKGSAVPTTASQLPPSHSWGTEIMERKFNHLLWFPLCEGKKLWARKHRWTHNWLLISAKGRSNCLHIRATSLTVHDVSTDLLCQQKETFFCHSIRH